jgi:hypothetical protein
MSYLFNNQVGFIPPYADASGRLRSSTPLTLLEHNNQFGTTSSKWDKLLTGTGTLTDTTASGTTTLSTGGTASGASAIRATRAYQRYQVQKSLQVGQAFIFGAGVTGVSKKVGYFDANNGVYFEQLGATLNVVVRSGGVDTKVAQGSWNVDNLNGSGPSGMTFNPLGLQGLSIDFLGTLLIRFNLIYNGTAIPFHVISAGNVASPVIPATANLTVRQEIVNTTSVASTSTLTVANINIDSEGAVEEAVAYNFSASNGTSTIAVTTRRPILTVQAKTLGIDGTSRNYGQILPIAVNTYCASISVYLEFVVNGTLTGASFNSVNANSIANFDVAATAISGGTVINSNYIAPGSGGGANGITTQPAFNKFPYVYSSLLNTQDTITVVATSLGASTNVSASIVWSELY